MNSTKQSDSLSPSEPEYPALTDEQRAEFYEFSANLKTWISLHPEVSVSFGWTETGKFLLVLCRGSKVITLYVDRDIEQEALWAALDDAADGKIAAPTEEVKEEWDW